MLGEAEPVPRVVLHDGFDAVELLFGWRDKLDALLAEALVVAVDVVGLEDTDAEGPLGPASSSARRFRPRTWARGPAGRGLSPSQAVPWGSASPSGGRPRRSWACRFGPRSLKCPGRTRGPPPGRSRRSSSGSGAGSRLTSRRRGFVLKIAPAAHDPLLESCGYPALGGP